MGVQDSVRTPICQSQACRQMHNNRQIRKRACGQVAHNSKKARAASQRYDGVHVQTSVLQFENGE